MVNRVVTRFNIRPFSFDGFGAALKYHHINRGFRISVFRHFRVLGRIWGPSRFGAYSLISLLD